MEGKILSLDNVKIYQQLAEKKAEQGDFVKSLGFLFSALKNCSDNKHQIIAEIARIYSQMELFELSNEYWFQYLDIAPKNQKSQAYLELAMNYFYLDKIWLSGRYFQLKFEQDGKIDSDEIDKEIFKVYYDSLNQDKSLGKSLYYVAYPESSANLSKIERRACMELGLGNYEGAIKYFKYVPKEVMSKKAYLDFATAYYATENFNQLITTCKNCLTYHGESLTCLCFLCTAYNYIDRQDKFQYYYDKAVTLFKSIEFVNQLKNNQESSIDEVYKLLACSAGNRDDEIVGECLEILLKDNPYDVSLIYYRAIYYLNTFKFYQAVETFSFLCKISPENALYLYYLDFAKNCTNEQSSLQSFLPFDYTIEFPAYLSKKYRDKAKTLLSGNKSGKIEIKNEKAIKMLCDGVLYGNDECAELCSQALSYGKTDGVFRQIRKLLLMPKITNITKRFFVYALLLNGEKNRFGVVINNMYKQIKPAKFSFSQKGFGEVVYSAYAAAFAWAISWNILEPEKVILVTKKLYKNYYHQMIEDNLNADEITAIILVSCAFPVIGNVDIICQSLGIKKSKIKKYIINFSSNDKNIDKGELND